MTRFKQVPRALDRDRHEEWHIGGDRLRKPTAPGPAVARPSFRLVRKPGALRQT